MDQSSAQVSPTRECKLEAPQPCWEPSQGEDVVLRAVQGRPQFDGRKAVVTSMLVPGMYQVKLSTEDLSGLSQMTFIIVKQNLTPWRKQDIAIHCCYRWIHWNREGELTQWQNGMVSWKHVLEDGFGPESAMHGNWHEETSENGKFLSVRFHHQGLEYWVKTHNFREISHDFLVMVGPCSAAQWCVLSKIV